MKLNLATYIQNRQEGEGSGKECISEGVEKRLGNSKEGGCLNE